MKEIFFDSLEYDIVAISSIDPKLLVCEPDLYQTKWWDYRLLHPAQATYLFADAYTEAARAYAQRNIDLEYGKVFKPYPGRDLFSKPQLMLRKDGTPRKEKGKDKYTKAPAKTTIAGMWKARQMSDRHGIPYRFYCDAAIEYTEKGIWHRLPGPQQLYSTKVSEAQADWREESMVDFIVRRWKEYCQRTIVFSDNPYFHADRNTNAIDQVRHRANLMGQIKARPDPKLGLSHALYEKQVLIEAECIRFFGENMVEKAKRFSSY